MDGCRLFLKPGRLQTICMQDVREEEQTCRHARCCRTTSCCTTTCMTAIPHTYTSASSPSADGSIFNQNAKSVATPKSQPQSLTDTSSIFHVFNHPEYCNTSPCKLVTRHMESIWKKLRSGEFDAQLNPMAPSFDDIMLKITTSTEKNKPRN